MNAITKAAPQALAIPEDEAIRVLQNSLYPGARPDSIRLVLAWCRATGRDPLKKPIHIVPMKVKDVTTGKEEWRDTLMPGIGTYRSDAANSGQYAGKTEPEFGADMTGDYDGMKVRHPAWCRVTVKRLVAGQLCDFTAKELWVENYATGYQGKGVNTMWRKRPYGQLAKVAEAQALRMAFPDETGNTNTSEEMDGKTFDGMTIEADTATPAIPDASAGRQAINDAIPDRVMDAPPPRKRTLGDWLAEMGPRMAALPDLAALDALVMSPEVKRVSDGLRGRALDEWEALMADAVARLGQAEDTIEGEVAEPEAADVLNDFPGDRP